MKIRGLPLRFQLLTDLVLTHLFNELQNQTSKTKDFIYYIRYLEESFMKII